MYTISYPSGVIRNDGVVVEPDDSKPAYQLYHQFLQTGGTPMQIPDQVDAERKPHATCTPWQLRKALNARGLREQVDSLVATLDQDARDGFEYATMWESDNPLLLAAIPELGMSESDLHDLITAASTL